MQFGIDVPKHTGGFYVFGSAKQKTPFNTGQQQANNEHESGAENRNANEID